MTFAGAFLVLASASCLPVSGDSIRAADLAMVSPIFAKLPQDAVLAPSPAPGIARSLTAADLTRMLARYGAGGQIETDICVERAGAVITREAALTAMQKALIGWNAEIEILSLPDIRFPEGVLEFPVSGLLQPGSDGVASWRGWLKTSEGRRYPVAARVKVALDSLQLVARENLPAGHPVQPGQIEVKKTRSHRAPSRQDLTLESAIGRVPRRSIRAGGILTASVLEAPRVIRAGQVVEVELRSGPIIVKLPGTAVGDGRLGETVKVKSGMNGEMLLARVEGPTKVVVEPAAGPASVRRTPAER